MNSGLHSVPRWWRGALIAATIALAACSASAPGEKFQASDITGASWGRDFHLLDTSGTPRSLADYHGRVVMMFFGYTNCPDECPTTLAKMAQASDRLGPDGTHVQGLFVTVDPARDVPAVLAQYVSAFNPTFVDLSGSSATIAATAKEFKVFYDAQKPEASGFYTVDHQAGIFVFDAHGRLRLFMGPTVTADAMVHDLGLLLHESAVENE